MLTCATNGPVDSSADDFRAFSALVKEHKDELDQIIGLVYEQVSSGTDAGADYADYADEGSAQAAEEQNGKRKWEDDHAVNDVQRSPSSAKKAKKGEDDEDLGGHG